VAAKRKTKANQPTYNFKPSKPKNGEQYSQTEFYENLQQACEFESKKQAKEVYEHFAAMVQAALKKGYKLPLPGLGKIQVREFKARMGRNPATGESIKIPARKRVRMTVAKALKEQVL